MHSACGTVANNAASAAARRQQDIDYQSKPATNATPLTHAVCQRRIVQRAALQYGRVHAPCGRQLPSALLPASCWGEVGGVEARRGGGLRDEWRRGKRDWVFLLARQAAAALKVSCTSEGRQHHG